MSTKNVGVDTKAGVVHLTGLVPSEADRRLVEHIAGARARIRWVEWVENDVIFGRKPELAETRDK